MGIRAKHIIVIYIKVSHGGTMFRILGETNSVFGSLEGEESKGHRREGEGNSYLFPFFRCFKN